MYIPTCSQNLKDKTEPKIRLLLQGDAGKGKTWSAMTFPNPLILDLDDGLTAFTGQEIPTAPFCNYDYVCNYMGGKFKPKNENAQPNRRDAVLHFLKNEATKLSPEQTLVVDGITGFEAALAQQLKWEPKVTDKGKVDDYHPWNMRIQFYTDMMTYLKSLHCNVVVTCHEVKVRNEQTGELIDKIGPLLQGKFVAQLRSHFDYVFRCVTEDKKNEQKKVIHTDYFWQIRSDTQFDAKSRLQIPDEVIYVEPHYKIFSQFPRVDTKNPYSTKQ